MVLAEWFSWFAMGLVLGHSIIKCHKNSSILTIVKHKLQGVKKAENKCFILPENVL